MRTLNINKDGVVATVALKPTSELTHAMMGENTVRVMFDSKEYIDLELGSYVDVFGSRYFLNTQPFVKKTGNKMFSYDVVFESWYYDLSKVVFLDVDSLGIHMSYEFSLTANIETFAAMLEKNLQRVYDFWDVEVVDPSDLVLTLSFSDQRCHQALRTICEEFDYEFKIERSQGRNTITIEKTIGATIQGRFEFGKGKGLYSLERGASGSSNVISRLYAYGSSKNIGDNYRNFSPRLRMPAQVIEDTPDIFVEIDVIDPMTEVYQVYYTTNASYVQIQLEIGGVWTDYGEVYPAGEYPLPVITTDMEAASNVDIKAWNVKGKYVFAVQEPFGWYSYQGVDYIETEAEMLSEHVMIFEDVYPRRVGEVVDVPSLLEFEDDQMFDLNEKDEYGTVYLINKVSPKVKFTSGKLSGYEFIVSKYDHTTKRFTIQQYIDERGLAIPSEDTEAFQVTPGDKYILLDIRMPESYIEDAEVELYDTAKEWLEKYNHQYVQYTLEIDPLFMKGKPDINAGDSVNVMDRDLGNTLMRVTQLKRNLVHEEKYDLVLADSLYKKKRRIFNRFDAKVQLDPQLKVGGDKNETYTVTNTREKVILHGMGKRPSVTIRDEEGTMCIVGVQYIGEDMIKITWSYLFTGFIELN